MLAWFFFCFAICFKVSIFVPKYATNLPGGTFLTLRGITKTSGIPIPGVSPSSASFFANQRRGSLLPQQYIVIAGYALFLTSRAREGLSPPLAAHLSVL